jgi:hypothetical protein
MEVDGGFSRKGALTKSYWMGYQRSGTSPTSPWYSVREPTKLLSVNVLSSGSPYYTHW